MPREIVTSENREDFIEKKLAEKAPKKKENPSDKPMAAKGLKSYRYKGRYGHIMIGAKDHNDALNEAKRSTSGNTSMDNLEIWDDKEKKYVNV
jgi:hypothetical protein